MTIPEWLSLMQGLLGGGFFPINEISIAYPQYDDAGSRIVDERITLSSGSHRQLIVPTVQERTGTDEELKGIRTFAASCGEMMRGYIHDQPELELGPPASLTLTEWTALLRVLSAVGWSTCPVCA